mmetsp:Transcript_70909/g.207776  ORF Transcript_70909/g.207776 Transcript_70909/m.207776 type:complete len:229 (+) Transcript_70909:281-967(+)
MALGPADNRCVARDGAGHWAGAVSKACGTRGGDGSRGHWAQTASSRHGLWGAWQRVATSSSHTWSQLPRLLRRRGRRGGQGRGGGRRRRGGRAVRRGPRSQGNPLRGHCAATCQVGADSPRGQRRLREATAPGPPGGRLRHARALGPGLPPATCHLWTAPIHHHRGKWRLGHRRHAVAPAEPDAAGGVGRNTGGVGSANALARLHVAQLLHGRLRRRGVLPRGLLRDQ